MESVHVRNPSMDDHHIDSEHMLRLANQKWKATARSIPPLFTKAPIVPAYISDEELVSPIDEDSVSTHSTDDSGSTFSDVSSLYSDDKYEDASLVSAQSIRIVTVGRPKVVDVPASPAWSSAGYFDHSFSLLRPSLDRNNTSIFSDASSLSIQDSIFSATEETAELAVPATPVILNFSRRRPSLPSKLGITGDGGKRRGHVATRSEPIPQSAYEDLTPTRDSMSEVRTYQPSTGNTPNRSPTTPQIAYTPSTPATPTTPNSISWSNGRKLVKSPPFFRALGNVVRQKSNKSSRDEVKRSQSVFARADSSEAPLDLQPLPATRKPKMQARGASERAVPIKLPPCPPNYEAEIEFSDPYSLQKEMIGVSPTSSPRNSIFSEKRRKSIFS